MQSRKVYQLLQQLNPETWPRFGEFLNSTYFGHSPQLSHFFEDLLPELPRSVNPSPIRIYRSLFPDREYSEMAFAKLCNALLSALHQFLIMEELQKLPSEQDALLFRAYSRRGLGKWVPPLYKKTEKSLFERSHYHPAALEALLNVKWEHAAYQFRQPRKPRGAALMEINSSLDHLYWMRKYELGAAIFNYNQLFDELELPDLPSISLEQLESAEMPRLVALNFHAYYLLTTGEESHFTYIWDSLRSFEGKADPVELRQFYLLCLNHCIYQNIQGREEYLEKMDEIYLELLEKGFLLLRGKLPAEHFKNIVSVRLQLGHPDWVEAFIEEYRDRLLNELEGAVISFARALVDFEKQDWNACLQHLENVLQEGKKDIFLSPDARILQMKAYYLRNAPGDDALVEHLQNAFRVFLIRNKKIGTEGRSRNQEFVRYFGKLLKFRGKLPDERKAGIQPLISEMENGAFFLGRKWLMDQLSLLLAPN